MPPKVTPADLAKALGANQQPPIPMRAVNRDAPGARTPNGVMWDYYQNEKNGFTRNGDWQHPTPDLSGLTAIQMNNFNGLRARGVAPTEALQMVLTNGNPPPPGVK